MNRDDRDDVRHIARLDNREICTRLELSATRTGPEGSGIGDVVAMVEGRG